MHHTINNKNNYLLKKKQKQLLYCERDKLKNYCSLLKKKKIIVLNLYLKLS